MQQGEIWIVEFDPSVGHEYQKTRPAIIITSNKKINWLKENLPEIFTEDKIDCDNLLLTYV